MLSVWVELRHFRASLYCVMRSLFRRDWMFVVFLCIVLLVVFL